MMAPALTGTRLVQICAATALLAVVVAGCGEKEEPSAAELDASSAEEELTADLPIAGRWKGELRQKGLKPFTVTAQITGPDGPNRVHYSGIDCSGTWTYEGRYNDRFIFQEVIDRGKGRKCKGAGTVTVTIAVDDRLDYEFRGGGIVSRGVLHRVS
jgi:hypothetical protein